VGIIRKEGRFLIYCRTIIEEVYFRLSKKIEDILGDFGNAGVFVWLLGRKKKKSLNKPKSKRVVTHAKN